ncbi:hypothetical protein Q9189_008232, partial [Teloschistes chrysophthalmus]
TGLVYCKKNFLNSFRAPEIGLNGTKANKEIVSTPSEHTVAGWDDMIPLSCQKAHDRPHRPRFHHPPGTICKIGNSIEVDSGYDSSDHSGSDSGHEAMSATISTCAISPGVCSSNEGQMKITVTGENRDSSWLDIDHFFNSDLEAEYGAAEGKCQETGKIKDKPRPDSTKDGYVGDDSQAIHYSVNRAVDGPGDRDIVKHGGEGTIADPEMEALEVDRQAFQYKDGHRAGFGVDPEG